MFRHIVDGAPAPGAGTGEGAASTLQTSSSDEVIAATRKPFLPAPAAFMSVPSPTQLEEAAEAALRANGFVPEFSPEVLAEVAAIDDPPDPGPAPLPRDLRQLPWTSIDNRSSLDLDQLEVAERLEDGRIRILLAIADVVTVVPLASAIDAHAATNTTSVYTGVAVFPMLPERLSTDITSLNEGEDRLAVVTQFDVADEGELSGAEVFRAVVHNHAKLTYAGVGAWLAGHSPPPAALAREPRLRAQVELHAEAARRLRASRRRGGGLDLESVEARPVVVNGRVIDLEVTARNRARDLIEEFMVAANRSVAAYLLDRGAPSIRRVVREPKRWDRIVALAGEYGVTLPDQPDSVALNEFLAARREADPENFPDLSLSIVKLLGPGIYVLERRLDGRRAAGHFGLAVADYVHSTAPNRRFADLVTQRLLLALERGEPAPYSDDELTEIAARCTERANAARKVERTMRKIAGAALMADRVGDDFAAIVTGASRKGTYVRLVNPPVEGRVVRGGDGLDVGDTVRVTLASVDVERGFVDFVHGDGDIGRKRERSRRKKRAADALRPRLGEVFDVVVTAVSGGATWVRLADGSAEGRLVRGEEGAAPGDALRARLVRADTVHGFIDFERADVADARKDARRERKRRIAAELRERVGDSFDLVVTGVTPRATWVASPDGEVEGRLVRGRAGLERGASLRGVLLATDPARGFVDFAREER